jgi:uncharacterized protein (TIGR02646 family)
VRFIDPGQVREAIPDGWEARAEVAHDEVSELSEDERAAAINNKGDLRRELKGPLADVANGKCWYCESVQDRSDNAVDHYRPKNRVAEGEDYGGYWWLAFRWENYRFSCTYCNSRRRDVEGGTEGGKQDHFPLWDEAKRCQCEDDDLDDKQPMLLDPCCEADPPLLWFDENGQPRPNPSPCGGADSYSSQRVTQSIRFYHLDHVDLVERRADLCNRIRRDTEKGDRMLQKMQRGDMTARTSVADTIARLKLDLAQ